MRGFAAILLVVLVHACGRIGFEAKVGDGGVVDAAPATDDALGPDDAVEPDDAAGTCGWQPCATGSEACCVGSAGMCAATGTCTGVVYACGNAQGGRCPVTAKCCFAPSGGSRCINLNTECNPM